MSKAWEITYKALHEAVPVIQTEEEKEWTENKIDIGDLDIEESRIRWMTNVPGSRAPDYVLLGGIQATENMGYDVSEAEKIIPQIQDAYDKHDDIQFLKLYSKIFNLLDNAPKVDGHPYWNYKYYNDFEEYIKDVKVTEYPKYQVDENTIFEKVHAGLLAQIAGAAIGTIIEGYTAEQLEKKFGDIRDYIRTPSTYNDDILFELAFLEAFLKKGVDITSEDIALEWIGRIEYTWSAEEAAFKNLKRGIFPPYSATVCNPWREWIGAQMRGSICGMISPGNPVFAAKMAWTDGRISHVNNGILGEVFNAVLVSLSYVESDIRKLIDLTIDMIPEHSEFYSVVSFAREACQKNKNWKDAWKLCEEKYRKYNWIHAYPNIAAEIVSLYYAEDSFDECMYICAMCGQDVDCNAGQIGTIYGIIHGYSGIDKRWTDPFHDQFDSLFRGYEHTTISEIAKKIVEAIELQ